MENIKKIISINGPVIIAKGEGDFAMHDMVKVGEKKLLGEVIKIEGNKSTIQVYEETAGLKINEVVETTGAPLLLTLGPGLIGNIFDGIQRPLGDLRKVSGDFIEKGIQIPSLDINKKWSFNPLIEVRTRSK